MAALRTKQLIIRVSEDERVALLESSSKSGLRLAAFLRTAALNELPAAVPEINREAWATLGKCAGNLATLATAMRSGDYVDIREISAELKAFRMSLIGAKGDQL